MNRKRRIILANKPRLLREILKSAFQKYPDLQIVGESRDTNDLLDQITEFKANWVVVSLQPNGEFPDSMQRILNHFPNLGIMAISSDGSQAKARCGDVYEKDLTHLSLNELVAMFRSQTEP